MMQFEVLATTNDEQQPFARQTRSVPTLGPQDLLIKIKATAVNPVDVKQRQTTIQTQQTRVLGFDAMGEIVDKGASVTDFAIGDAVFYAGELKRDGSNATYQVVDARLVAQAPDNWTPTELASLPLTFLTAYELLADKFGLTMTANSAVGQTLLIVNGAGGVGSIMIQLAKWLGMTVIATASRRTTVNWVREMGADMVVNHREDYVAALAAMSVTTIPYIAVLHQLEPHFERVATLVAPFGHIGAIVESIDPLPVNLLKNKSASLDWEFMFAKANYQVDMASQGQALQLAAQLITTGILKPTLTHAYQGLTAANLVAAQELVMAGEVYGKIALEV